MCDTISSTSRFTKRTYRKPYKKSTKGCTACKTRKIKCDELRPACGNCRKRFVDMGRCVYATAPRSIDSSSVASSRDDTLHHDANLSIHHAISPTPSSTLLELRLIHHYTKSTCGKQSLADMVPILSHPMWEVDIPQIAFSSDLALNALLAISALDLSSRMPDDKALAFASKNYFDQAVAKHRVEVAKINASSAQPLLVTAVLIAHHTWLTSYSEPLEKTYVTDLLSTFYMCEGIILLVESTPSLRSFRWPASACKDHSKDDIMYAKFLRSALQNMRTVLMCINTEQFDSEDAETYERTGQEIVEIFYLIAGGSASVTEIEQDIVTFLHRVPRRFVTLLQQHEPVALALLARSLSLLELVKDSKAWWIHGSEKYKAGSKAVDHIRALMPTEWLWTLQWPMKVIHKEIMLE